MDQIESSWKLKLLTGKQNDGDDGRIGRGWRRRSAAPPDKAKTAAGSAPHGEDDGLLDGVPRRRNRRQRRTSRAPAPATFRRRLRPPWFTVFRKKSSGWCEIRWAEGLKRLDRLVQSETTATTFGACQCRRRRQIETSSKFGQPGGLFLGESWGKRCLGFWGLYRRSFVANG